MAVRADATATAQKLEPAGLIAAHGIDRRVGNADWYLCSRRERKAALHHLVVPEASLRCFLAQTDDTIQTDRRFCGVRVARQGIAHACRGMTSTVTTDGH